VKKRFGILILVGSFIALGVALAVPKSHFAIMGWLRGEAFYLSHPTSYWSGALRKDPLIGAQGDVGKTLREGGDKAVPVLCELLGDKDKYVREQAQLALSIIDWDPRIAAPAMVATLRSAKEPLFCVRTIRRFSVRDPQLFIRELQKAMDAMPNGERRAAIALAVGWLGQENALAAFRLALADGSPPIRVRAAYALWRQEHDLETVLPAFLECLQDPEPEAHQAAQFALANIGQKDKDQIRPKLAKLLEHQDPDVRARVGSVMESLDSPAISSGQEARNDKQPAARSAVAVPLEKAESVTRRSKPQ
jgi:HEAT repeat protein